MPELPEVEAARKLAHEHCAGKRITKVVCEDDETVIQDVKPAELARELQGRTVKDVHRKGKSLWFEMDDEGPWPSFHFGMTGSFSVKGVESVKYRAVAEGDPEQWPPRFHKVVISFEGGVELAFCDARRFARVRYLEDVTLKSPISDLGPDAYTELPDAHGFHASLLKRRAAIKAVLLDQGFLAGIGNWVADEVLYHAGVHPESLAAELDKEAAGALRESIRMVLETAVAANADSDQYPPHWLFHHRWDARGAKKEAPRINGHEVAFLKVGGRTSAYLPDLQKRVGGTGGAKAKAAKARKKRSRKDEDSDDEEDFEAEPAGQTDPEPAPKASVKDRRAAAKAADEKKSASKASKEVAEKSLPAKKRGIAKEEEEEEPESKGRKRKAVSEKAAPAAQRGHRKAEEPVLEEEAPAKKGRGKKADDMEKSVAAKGARGRTGAEQGPGSEEAPAKEQKGADPEADKEEAAEPEGEESKRETDEATGAPSLEKVTDDAHEETPGLDTEPEKVGETVAEESPLVDGGQDTDPQEEGKAEVEGGKKKAGAKRGRRQSSEVEAPVETEPRRKSSRSR